MHMEIKFFFEQQNKEFTPGKKVAVDRCQMNLIVLKENLRLLDNINKNIKTGVWRFKLNYPCILVVVMNFG